MPPRHSLGFFRQAESDAVGAPHVQTKTSSYLAHTQMTDHFLDASSCRRQKIVPDDAFKVVHSQSVQ